MLASWITRRWKRCASARCAAYRLAKAPRLLHDPCGSTAVRSARWLGSAESQAAFGQAAQTGCARLAMDLQHPHAEEPVATEVRLRAGDARHGGKADQG